MISNFRPNKKYSIAEKFMAEKLLELFFYKTMDSYRAKLNNPYWILIELYQVLCDWDRKKIKNFDRTIFPVILETLKFIENDETLDFLPVNKKYFTELLGKATDKNYQQLSYANKLLIEKNKGYSNNLFQIIEAEIMDLNQKSIAPQDLEELSKHLDFLSTELINQGYSKGYLYFVISKLFSENAQKNFSDAFDEIKNLSTRDAEKFLVVFKLLKLGGGNKKIDIKTQLEINEEKIKELSAINDKSKAFFSKQGDFTYFIAVNLKGLDYLSVIEKAKKELFTIMDILHLGYPDNPFDFHKKCLVVGTRKRELTNIRPVNYVTDGNYKNNDELYELLLNKIKRLTKKNKIQNESLQKAVSAYRHLRLGRDADELEQKFINYWIGLEYIFSNYDINDNTVTRLKEFFIHAHSTAYIKRNIKEFHNDIARLKLGEAIEGFADDLHYLKNIDTYDNIIKEFFEGFPLLGFRAMKYKDLISSDKNLTAAIIKHRKNLDWHITRIYRIRNEIVHDAAIHLNIESITGNLKYYLTYILNGLIDYLDNAPFDINSDGFITIEDYFLLQEIRYNSLNKAGFNLEELMNEKSVTEIFSN